MVDEHLWFPSDFDPLLHSGAQLDHQTCHIVLAGKVTEFTMNISRRESPGFLEEKSEFEEENLGVDTRNFIFSSRKNDGLVQSVYDMILYNC